MHPLIACSKCGHAFPEKGMPYCCPRCGGFYDFSDKPSLNLGLVDPSQPGIWKYRHTFGIDQDCEPISLGEGNTPLVWAESFGRNIAYKCEYYNPSGSFKDRGSSVIVGWLKSRGVREAVEDSSGNAGASLAAYAARAGIKTHIYIPEFASGPKRRQITAYGAELVVVPGSRGEVARVVKKKAIGESVYASHAYLPFNIPGYATAAYEIYEQLGNQMPGAIIVPVGQGGLLLGLACGFTNLRIANTNIKHFPMMIGVQVSACAPLYCLYKNERYESDSRNSMGTLGEGVNVESPLRAEAVIRAIKDSKGGIYKVEEEEILAGRDNLVRLGFYVEPTSSIVWPVLKKIINVLPDPVVVLLTGSGYKYEHLN